jgi:ketosteroid isomerase-like protein
MSTAQAVMTTQEVANRFNELAQSGNWKQIHDELFADDAASVEPPNSPGMQTVEGLDNIRNKGKQFEEMVDEMYGGYSNAPQVAGRYFAVAMGMDCKMKGHERMKMDEIALYEVKDGKIVKEQFFY